jgi:protein AbiQ
MDIKKLDSSFYQQNEGLKETLFKPGEGGDQRGYAIVLLTVHGLTFGVPLRSHMRHKHGFPTREEKALDYTKALLILDEQHISNTFRIPHEEFVYIQDNAAKITSEFELYVDGYIKMCKTASPNTIARREKYKYSTLQNYHSELGI